MVVEKLEEFLWQSNYIEREYSDEAYADARKAWDYAYEGRENINLKYVLGIHGILLQNLWPEIAGKVRDRRINVGGKRVPRVYDVLGQDVSDKTKIHLDIEGGRWYEKKPKRELEGEIKNWIKSCEEMNCAEDVKQAHIRFEHMHPFTDGNGRTGRILMNIQRLNLGLDLLVIHQGLEQMNYYKWFRQSD